MSLTFENLRIANRERCEKHFHRLDDWSEPEWGCALSGEVGELNNIIKKRLRIFKTSGYTGFSDNFKALDSLRLDAKKEIGDILVYLDLLAQAMEFKLEDCVTEKFNEVSDRIGSTIKL